MSIKQLTRTRGTGQVQRENQLFPNRWTVILGYSHQDCRDMGFLAYKVISKIRFLCASISSRLIVSDQHRGLGPDVWVNPSIDQQHQTPL